MNLLAHCYYNHCRLIIQLRNISKKEIHDNHNQIPLQINTVTDLHRHFKSK